MHVDETYVSKALVSRVKNGRCRGSDQRSSLSATRPLATSTIGLDEHDI